MGEVFGFLKFFGSVNQRFRRNTADIKTGAAKIVTFNQDGCNASCAARIAAM